MTRSAISPRWAMRIFLNMSGGPDREQPLAVLHRLAVLHVGVYDLAVVLGRDLVHQFHRLDDAEHLVFLDALPDFDERRRARLRASVEGADDRRLHDGEFGRFLLVG